MSDVKVLLLGQDPYHNEHQAHGWEQFTDAGCRIIYGIDYTKVHSKICLISYIEDNCIKHISQIGTGNYNEKTSKLYTDLSLMTANEEIS